MRIELIPSAKRLIRSLRDIGYEFVDAVADVVDNSVEAEATVIKITLNFDGEDSYLVIADNGIGMAPKEIQESLRFGSNRNYDEEMVKLHLCRVTLLSAKQLGKMYAKALKKCCP